MPTLKFRSTKKEGTKSAKYAKATSTSTIESGSEVHRDWAIGKHVQLLFCWNQTIDQSDCVVSDMTERSRCICHNDYNRFYFW